MQENEWILLKNKLKKLNRKFAKTQTSSNNHQKIRIKIAKLNEKIRNQRLWYIHHIINHFEEYKLLNGQEVAQKLYDKSQEIYKQYPEFKKKLL